MALLIAVLAYLHTMPAPRADADRRWGRRGHEMAARAAAASLPPAIPAFFRDATERLAYLAPEPDRWRSRTRLAMDRAWSYDHYVDLENVPEGALDAPDRYAFIRRLHAAGIERPEEQVGFLPYRIVELYERLVTEWQLWSAEADSATRSFIEDRIVDDAGILGHYVTDASQPLHVTVHFNGWAAGAPNPEGYTTDRSLHARFEQRFVDARVTQADVSARVLAPPEALADVPSAVRSYLRRSHAEVDTLYRLEKDFGFDPNGPLRAATRDFTAERLADGARMLATLWWSAWREGAGA